MNGTFSASAGGCVFPHDPDIPVTRVPIIWQSRATTSVISLTPALDIFDPPPLPAFPAIGKQVLHRADRLGQVVVLASGGSTFTLSLHGKWNAATRPAIHLPLDPHYRRRSDEALRFSAVVLGHRLPARHPRRITPARQRQLVLRLHAYDLTDASASLRQIAATLLDSSALTMPDDVWRDSSLRTMARTLRDEGSALVHGGYVSLLDGL